MEKDKIKIFRVRNRDIKIKLHELLFINTNTFQRLYHIKQLGLAYLVYPFASHTRAMHCLDCLDMAQRFIDSLKSNNDSFSKIVEEDTDIIRAGALLHDISHIPFSHALEDENRLLKRHDKSERIRKIIERMKKELDELKDDEYRTFSYSSQEEFIKAKEYCIYLLDYVSKIIWTIALHDEIEEQIKFEKRNTPSKEVYEKVKKNIENKEEHRELKVEILEADKYYIADIIGNTISADLLSYTLLDPEFAGLEGRPGGWYRLFNYVHLVKDDFGRIRMSIKLMKKGEWRLDVFSTIIRILNTRYEIAELINYHHAKICADAMLGKIAQFCNLSESDELYDIGDEGFFELLKKRIENNNIIEIKNWKKEDIREAAKKLLENLRTRRLHKRFHVVKDTKSPEGYDLPEKYVNPEERLGLEMYIINQLGLKPGDIIVFCPERKGFMKEAKTLVTLEKIDTNRNLLSWNLPLNDDECINYLEKEIGESIANKIRYVEKQYIDLWKLYVFVDPTIIPIYGAAIKQILNQKLGPSSAFDLAYLEPTAEYKYSKQIWDEINKRVAEAERGKVYRYIPQAIEMQVQRRKQPKEGKQLIKYIHIYSEKVELPIENIIIKYFDEKVELPIENIIESAIKLARDQE
jgi:HD superfamily phosphohydrolase